MKPRFFELIRPNHNFDFVGKMKPLMMGSLILVVLSLAMLPLNKYVFTKSRGHAMNLSTDLGGAIEVSVPFTRPIDIAKLREVIQNAGFKDPEVVSYGENDGKQYLVRSLAASGLDSAQKEKLKNVLSAKMGADAVEILDFNENRESGYVYLKKSTKGESTISVIQQAFTEAGISTSEISVAEEKQKLQPDLQVYRVFLGNTGARMLSVLQENFGKDSIDKSKLDVNDVGAKAGNELTTNAVISLLAAIGCIMIYILVRFDFRYGPGTVAALLHDAILVVGAFALLYKEFSLTTIAAILTVIGYSMNDTIVVFDRIRENSKKYKDKKFAEVINLSINETLSRTILTSATVFFVTLSMNIFGTGIIRDFGFAMNIGVVVGTYSSIFVACPVLLWLHERGQSRKK